MASCSVLLHINKPLHQFILHLQHRLLLLAGNNKQIIFTFHQIDDLLSPKLLLVAHAILHSEAS